MIRNGQFSYEAEEVDWLFGQDVMGRNQPCIKRDSVGK